MTQTKSILSKVYLIFNLLHCYSSILLHFDEQNKHLTSFHCYCDKHEYTKHQTHTSSHIKSDHLTVLLVRCKPVLSVASTSGGLRFGPVKQILYHKDNKDPNCEHVIFLHLSHIYSLKLKPQLDISLLFCTMINQIKKFQPICFRCNNLISAQNKATKMEGQPKEIHGTTETIQGTPMAT